MSGRIRITCPLCNPLVFALYPPSPVVRLIVETDPDDGWRTGKILRCPDCGEELRVYPSEETVILTWSSGVSTEDLAQRIPIGPDIFE